MQASTLLSCSHLLIYSQSLIHAATTNGDAAANRRLPFTHADDRVLEIYAISEVELNSLTDLGLDVWKREYETGVRTGRDEAGRFLKRVVARVPAAKAGEYPREYKDQLDSALDNFVLKDIDVDLDELIEKSFTGRVTSKSMPAAEYDYNIYHDLDEMNSWMDSMESANPDRISMSTFGTTIEGRDIRMMTINPSSGPADRAVFVDCGIHAREWISHAWCQHLVNYLMNNPGGDAEIDAMSQGLTWYVVPVLNPDGYAYTWAENRMWRKNRKDNGRCMGVDNNRNYDANFGGPGSSDNPCSESYRGTSVFSELESSSQRDLMQGIQEATGNSIKLFLTYHSYSQMMIFPYAYDFTSVPANYDELLALGQDTVKAIFDTHGKVYTTGQTTETLYPAAGGSDDWAYDHAGMDLVYTIELRDTGVNGFILPEDQILPTAEESMAGMKVMAKYVMENR